MAGVDCGGGYAVRFAVGRRSGGGAGFARESYGDVNRAKGRAIGVSRGGELRRAGGAGNWHAGSPGGRGGEGKVALGGARGILGASPAKIGRSAQGIVWARAAGGWVGGEDGRGDFVRPGGAARRRGT